MGKFDKYHNMKILEQGLEAFIKKKAIPDMREKLIRVAEEMQKVIEKDKNIPVFTGNLRNSVGVVVLDNGHVIKSSVGPKSIPTKPPHVQSAGAAATGDYGIPIYDIIGKEYLQKALDYQEGMYRGMDDNPLHIVVFAAVPYAAYINEYGAAKPKHQWGNPETASGGSGQGFFNELVGWELVGRLGREFFKGNKKVIDIAYRIVQ